VGVREHGNLTHSQHWRVKSQYVVDVVSEALWAVIQNFNYINTLQYRTNGAAGTQVDHDAFWFNINYRLFECISNILLEIREFGSFIKNLHTF
jgi:hypothetical protein